MAIDTVDDPTGEAFSAKWQRLLHLALEDIDEGWETIDAELPELSQTDDFLRAAKQALVDKDCRVRDLAASTFELTDSRPDTEVLKNLKEIALREIDPENEADQPYDAYHAAFACWKHGDRSPDIQSIIEAAATDDATSEAALKYLQKIASDSL